MTWVLDILCFFSLVLCISGLRLNTAPEPNQLAISNAFKVDNEIFWKHATERENLHFEKKWSASMDVWVASGGGTGTNLIWEWLRSEGIKAGSLESPWGNWMCHAIAPTTDDARYAVPATTEDRSYMAQVKKAIFVYSSEPCRQVASLYRRWPVPPHLQKKLRLFNQTESQTTDSMPQTFKGYVKQGDDALLMESQFLAWSHSEPKPNFPIMMLNFDKLWEPGHIEQLVQFAGLHESAASRFPPWKAGAEYDLTLCEQSSMFDRLRAAIQDYIQQNRSVTIV